MSLKVWRSVLLPTVVILLLLGGCQAKVTTPPAPEEECPMGVLSWNGLQPGVSTKEDVLAALGEPDEQGWRTYVYTARPESREWYFRYAKEKLEYFAYFVDDGKISEYLGRDYVYFYPDDRVYWISVVIGDRDGEFHTIQELAGDMWPQVDAINVNHSKNNRLRPLPDAIMGESEVWEWDRCGLFLESYPFIEKDSGDAGQCFRATGLTNVTSDIETSYFDFFSAGSYRNPESIVLAQYLFPPTTHEGVRNYYDRKFPFYLFDDNFVDNLCGDEE